MGKRESETSSWEPSVAEKEQGGFGTLRSGDEK